MATNKPFQMYPFQRRVYDAITRGENVILQAPTGSGKTRAALSPFVNNLAKTGRALPLTCRYAVPQRVLANQFLREYEFLAQKIDQSSAEARLEDIYREIGRKAVSVQTGEQPEDAQMEAALTFCTIDQLLASFLGIPYGLGLKRANLNVAGVLGSYLVLDEFHLYPLLNEENVFGARTTALQMLRLLKKTTPFILMTATFSSSLVKRLGTLLDAWVIEAKSEEELAEIAQGRARTFWRSEIPLDPEVILNEHRQRPTNKCTLVVCNTVRRAQECYLKLKQAEAEGTRVVLLHSRFTTADRRALSLEIEAELGPDKWREEDGKYLGKDLIVVATQVVEVGLNISVEVLHTENAPASSLIQRAGRCARFARQQGQVWIYPLADNEDGSAASTLPYNKDLCAATWHNLGQFHGQVVGFTQEQVLIDAVHTPEDTAFLDQYATDEGQIQEKIFTCLQTNDRSFASALIRDVAQVQILIHDDPNGAIQEAPWQWESFGMHPGSLMSPARWQALQARAASAQDDLPVCWEAEPLVQEQKEDEDLDNKEKTRYRWKPVASASAIPKALMLAFPRHLAHYDNQLGFLLLDEQLEQTVVPGTYQSIHIPARMPNFEQAGARQQSYQEHIAGLLRAYNFRIRTEIGYVAEHLERDMGLEAGTIDQAIKLAIACHDLGKLNQSWQAWALEWQQLIYWERHKLAYTLPRAGYCFAKTDYTWREQRDLQAKVRAKRPNHACESVMLGRTLIGHSLGLAPGTRQEYTPVLRAICGAIARHHTAQASEYHAARLSPQALQSAAVALAQTLVYSNGNYDPKHLLNSIEAGGDLDPAEADKSKLTRPGCATPEQERETWLYFLIVRALRLSDQRAG